MRSKIKSIIRSTTNDEQVRFCRDGSTLVLAILAMVILSALGVGMLATAYGVRHRAIRLKNETAALLAAEAGYEKAIYWMGQQKDMLSALQQDAAGTRDALSFADSSCNYQIKLFAFVGSRPVYRVISNGHSGTFDRTVEVYVVQALSGWDMGMCRVPMGQDKTYPVNFADDEIINMRVHINEFEDNPDERDIYIIGEPQFLAPVSMGESKYRENGDDKPGYNDRRDYDDLMPLFKDGIYFDQPECKITEETTMQSKLERFKNSTKPQFILKPIESSSISNPQPAVQLEFFVEDGIGKVRITNNCTVRGYQRNYDDTTWDLKIKPDSDPQEYERYYIYAYHFMPQGGERTIVLVEQTYVTQSFGGVESKLGGQIYVEGNVIIGGDMLLHNEDQVVKGRMTVVATGNIWVADSILLDGAHDANGLPAADNLNIFGLIAEGVVKVIDPGISSYSSGGTNSYPGPPSTPSGLEYVPIGRHDEGKWVQQKVKGKLVNVWQEAEVYKRHLPDPMIVEAAVTVGGGGWGAENVGYYNRTYYGGRKEEGEESESWDEEDYLILRGSITESMRGVVGLINKDGFIKHYYTDERILEGILPGDIWLRGKYIPAPAGWHDYRH